MKFLLRVVCLFFGHKYVLTQNLSKQSRRVACTRCRQMFAMNDDVRAVVPWDSNPRCIAAHWFSRPAPSAARTALLVDSGEFNSSSLPE